MPDTSQDLAQLVYGPDAARRRLRRYARQDTLERLAFIRRAVAEVFYILVFLLVLTGLACFLTAALVGLL